MRCKNLNIALLFLFVCNSIIGQDTTKIPRKDISSLSPDALIGRYKKSLAALSDSNKYIIKWPSVSLPAINIKNPLRINSGYLIYNFDYRSNIDTPYSDKNIAQHSLSGQLAVNLLGGLPININFFGRRTNSSLFADITDIRADFNVGRYAEMIRNDYLKKLSRQSPAIKDSLLSQLTRFQSLELSKIIKRISDPDFKQRLVECNEIIRVPGIAESIAGKEKADSVKQVAREFMGTYNSIKSEENKYRKRIDSLQGLISASVAKARLLKETLSGNINLNASPDQVITMLREQGINVPSSVRHLLSIRKFSVGRSQLNYSELTARNLSINGINVEYNSWYYFAFAAGVIDYRFRDFILTRSNRKPQFMYLARLGVGRLEKNYIILSAYRGQKQSYIQNNSSSGRSSNLAIYGMSLESKYRINKNSYLITEVAQSSTPGINLYSDQKTSSFFNWKSNISKAYAAKLFTYFPRTRTRVEAMYRYNGAAFQSFDRFQSNSARETWYIKGEQSFWKRQLKLSASLRKNEFSNPYIQVPYSNNSISKSVQLTFRKRKWPVISAGLMPFSQLTVVNDQVFENRFHTLNALLYHQYNVGAMQTSTTLNYNRFYNSAADTGFIYFNAVNIYFQQYFYFRKLTLSAGGSHSRNNGFELNTLEESVQANIIKNGTITFGLKISNYNRTETKTGSWLRIGYRFMKTGALQLHYENGFLPGNKTTLTRNELCSIMLTKMF